MCAPTMRSWFLSAHIIPPPAACLLVFILLTPDLCSANVIQNENAKTGTTEWQATNLTHSGEIEGYASLTSVNRGEEISFFVSTTDPRFTIDIFRMGWYGGAGGRRMLPTIELNGTQQTMPVADPVTGLIECAWTVSYVLTIPNNTSDPSDWASGVYLAKLTGTTSGKQRYIIFVVRDDARPSDYFFQTSVNTYQAYNNWGGKSLFNSNSVGGAARKVSFNRPYDGGYGKDGAGDFLQGWEYNMVRFLEREGYDVSYGTDLDAHQNPSLLLSHKALLIVGHNEFWSWEMRQNTEAAREQGVSLGFFAANTCYWQVRFEPSLLTGELNRTMVGYKDYSLTEDPFFLDGDPFNDHLVTVRWREFPVSEPEDAFIGVMFETEPVDADLVITNPSHWAFASTGLQDNDRLPGLLGYEVDRMFGNAPAHTELVAHSPFPIEGTTRYSDMTAYTAPSGATVFATGTIQWSWGLDDYNVPRERTSRLHPAAQQITRNVLARLIFSNQSPLANTGGPYSGNPEEPIQFDGSGSLDPDGAVTAYEWNFGDGGTGNGAFPTYTYSTFGTYTVTLIVTDDRGWRASATTTSTIGKATATLTSLSLDFPPQPIGYTSSGQTVVLTSSGETALSIASIVISGDFAQTANCPLAPATLAVGANCAITVTFTPRALGTAIGQITITDNALDSPQIIALTGMGDEPAVIGVWSPVDTWPEVAVHGHLLPTGKVLFFPEADNPYLWDPVTDTFAAVEKAGYNIYCSGHSFLADGKLLLTGGHGIDNYFGLPHAILYDALADGWTRLPDMNDGRWYPTNTTLPSGEVLVISGTIDLSVRNELAQVWQPGIGAWRDLTTAPWDGALYPWMFVAPNGKVFNAGPSAYTRYLDTGGTGSWAAVASSNFGPRAQGTAAMYDSGKVLIVGGGDPPTATAEVIDLTSLSPAWRTVASMASARRHPNVTLLPDGKLLVAGGTSGSGFEDPSFPTYAAELWDPETEGWSTLASASSYRGYHSVALLLPDGRVLTAGGAVTGASAEVYSPPYLFRGARPTITSARNAVSYNQTFFVGTPDAADITKVTWLRLNSVTHSYDQNQRINHLTFSAAPGGLNVTTPASGALCPPGHYMLFIVNADGVPSVAHIIRIEPPSGTPPTAPTNLTATAVSGTQVNLSWADNSSDEEGFLLERSLDGNTFIEIAALGANETEYLDTGLSLATTYYYRVRSYNLAGDSAYSAVADITTPTLPAAPSNLIAAAISTSQINLNWTDSANNEDGFSVERSSDGTTFTALASVGANTTSYSDPALAQGTTYYYRVHAFNGVGNSADSNVASATTFAPTVSLSTTNLNFGDQRVGNPSTAQRITLSNTGSATLTVSGITVTGDFSEAHTCGTNLAAGANCAIDVTFTPTVAGTRTGTLTIIHDAPGNPHTVSLTGTGVQPAVTLSLASLAFGNQLVGTTSPAQTVTLTNSGTSVLTFSGITITGAHSTDFAQTNTCGANLAAGANCTISVTFTPTTTGTRTGAVSITDDAPGSPHVVSLSGTGVAPAVGLSPATLIFGSQVVGTTGAAQSVTVTNTGTSDLNFTSFTASGDFAVEGATTPCVVSTPLAPSASCAVGVTFTPTATGTRSGNLSFVSNAGTSVVTLSGTGTAPGVSLTPSSLTFGGQVVGTTSAVQSVTLANTGTSALTISAISLSGEFALDSSTTCSTSTPVAASASCTISVTFTPTITGTRTGLVTISDDAPSSPQVVALTGTGTAPGVSLTPSSLTFGSQVVGTTSAVQSVTLENTGTSALTISSISLSGDFALDSSTTCSTSAPVAALTSCTIAVTFTPTITGTRTGAVTITDDASGGMQTVAVSGTGTVPGVSLSPGNVDFGPQAVGTMSGTRTVTVTNTGDAPLMVFTVSISGHVGDYEDTTNCMSLSPIAPGAACDISIRFAPTTTGARSGHLTVEDDAPGSPHEGNLSGTGVDFTMEVSSGSSTSATVAAGQTANYELVLNPTGFSGTVAMSCSGAPPRATCSVSPSSLALDGSTPAEVTVSVTTTARSLAPPGHPVGPLGGKRSPMTPWLLWLASLLMIAGCRLAARRRAVWGLTAVVLAVMVWAACGGGGGAPAPSPVQTGTPAGTYTLTVTATAGNLTHSTSLTLRVN